MSVTEFTSATPFKLTLHTAADVNDGGEVEITATNLVGAGVTPEAIAAAQADATQGIADAATAQGDATDAITRTSIVALTGVASVAIGTAGEFYLQVPTGLSGTVSLITGVANGDPGADVAFTASIGTSGGAYTPITNGAFTVANGAAAGERDQATPTAANAVTGGTSIILIDWDNAAVAAFLEGITVEITRS